MKFFAFLSLLIFSFQWSFAQDNPAYVIFDAKGKKVSYSKMEKALLKKKFVFFGELHNNPVAHWLQLSVLEALYAVHGSNLIAGSEMFERDNQGILTDFQKGSVDAKKFEDSCRLWANYKTDYKPMLLFANEHNIRWVATNIPRRYASLVFKKGTSALDTLTALEKSWIAPLPFPVDTNLSQYKNLLENAMHNGVNFVNAQAIKDATMGNSIAGAMTPNTVFYHLNGSYHSDFHQGILWYLNQYGKFSLSDMITVSTVSQENLKKLDKEFIGKADFIICVPEKMTKTH